MFLRSLSSQTRSRYSFIFSLLFIFTLWSEKSTFQRVIFFCWLSLDLVVWLRFDLFVSLNPREVCAFHSQDRFLVKHIPFVRMVKYKFPSQFPLGQVPHPAISSLKLILPMLPHSSQGPHILHLLFCCVLSIFLCFNNAGLYWVFFFMLSCVKIKFLS